VVEVLLQLIKNFLSKLRSEKKFEYVASQDRLDSLLLMISEAKIIALDTEFTRETTYFPILSIIQIAFFDAQKRKKYFIVDCLSGIDLSGLFRIIADKEIIKIIHSARQDLQIFYHQSGLMPAGIMDTQIMANICGIGCNAGYSKLVENFFKRTIDKKQQRSNWQRRPLSKQQLNYAVIDVEFLEEIYQKLYDLLKKKNRLSWYSEEISNDMSRFFSESNEGLMRNFSFRGKTSREIFITKKIILCRDAWARKINIPRRHLLRDEMIEKIVLGKVDHQRLSEMVGEKMAEEVSQILLLTEIEEAKIERLRMSEREKKNFEKAKNLVGDLSENLGVADQFLMSREALRKIICNPETLNQNIAEWRYKLFGKQLEDLIQN
jgi:ribonuclease D